MYVKSTMHMLVVHLIKYYVVISQHETLNHKLKIFKKNILFNHHEITYYILIHD